MNMTFPGIRGVTHWAKERGEAAVRGAGVTSRELTDLN